MKKKILVLMISLLFIPQVKAECSNDRLNEIKELAKNIEITYELDTELEKDKNYSVNKFGETLPDGNIKIIITGMFSSVRLIDETYNRTFYYLDVENGIINLNKEVPGNISFKVYSSECKKEIRTIKLKIPKYNAYSEDPLCQGIDKKELRICDAWHETDIDYETFKKEVNDYKNRLAEAEKQKNKEEKDIVKKLTNFFENNYIYCLIGVGIVAIIIVIAHIKRKRSVLE